MKTTKCYNESNQLHREDGPAIEYADGGKAYYINGKLHREEGPAVESAYGDKFYYRNGKLHREDRPAIEWANGYIEYYRNGKQLTEEKFNGNTAEKAADQYAHNYFDMHETNSYKELRKGFMAGVEWANKT